MFQYESRDKNVSELQKNITAIAVILVFSIASVAIARNEVCFDGKKRLVDTEKYLVIVSSGSVAG